MIRLLLALALLGSGCAPAGCDGPALAFRTPTGPNHYVAPGDMASGGGGSWSFVQATSSWTTGGSTTPPISLSFSSNVTAGSLLVAGLRCAPGSGAVALATNLGQNFVEIGSGVSYQSRDHRFFYLKNAASGATTVTASGSYSPGTYFDFGNIPLVIAEYSGLSTSAPLADQATKTDGGSYYSMTTTSVTATANGLLLVLASNDDGDRAITPDAQVTSRASVNTPSNNGFQLLQLTSPTSSGATGSVTVGAVVNSYWSTIAAAFTL